MSTPPPRRFRSADRPKHRLIRGNTMTPTFTRGPGESAGSFVLESAMDELAHALAIDPVELRVRAHAATDPHGNPWTSDGLEQCLRRGAERFGWPQRNPMPRTSRDSDRLIG
ncbi:MAG TPA: molybdopterin cofactor-binding domain-containing protein, partial [Mycobacteriales bacterium]